MRFGNRLIYSGGSLLIGLLVRILYSSTLGGNVDQAYVAPQPSLRDRLITQVIEQLGGASLHQREIHFISALAVIYSVFISFFTQQFLGEKGFGRGLNSTICLIGAVISAYVYHTFFGDFTLENLNIFLIVGVLGSVSVLMLAAVIKSFVMGEIDSVMVGVGTKSAAFLRPARSVVARSVPFAQPSQNNAKINSDRMAQALRKR